MQWTWLKLSATVISVQEAPGNLPDDWILYYAVLSSMDGYLIEYYHHASGHFASVYHIMYWGVH